MRITIIGTGYVGLVTGACLAEQGNDVFCLDLDAAKIALLNDGGIPIHEPGLVDVVLRNRNAGRLVFSSDIGAAVAHGELLFIAVGTPPDEDGSADLTHVLSAAESIGRHMTGFKVVVDKSTVPVGTGDRVGAIIGGHLALRGVDATFSVVSNPEFLKEGAAVEDFMRPDRIVIGHANDKEGERARLLMTQLYRPFNRHRERTHWMDVRSAEFTKYAANAMLATRISFMNELANLADQVGADIEAVRRGIGSDPRIGHGFLYAGAGYGGSCFPKDVRALSHTASQHDLELLILRAVETVNERQKQVLGRKVMRRFGRDLAGKRFAVWGLSFKPNTDDMRGAPARVLLRELIDSGASVAVFDPVAMDEAARVFARDFTADELARIDFVAGPMEALDGAEALVIVTEWKAFRSPDFAQIKARLNYPVIFDGRNLFQPQLMAEYGIEYHGIGRSALTRTH
ncbi:UDP-glucose dehydrogenase family protein [Massilia glaciei]|uniref:UDP-glucose 6-dehydrogenase n=1 Tax=Massilia glaciei TaxID=1524097 RepID=A0A2U2I4D8_9BURK|nr:UDP-glucose/GDP-mannose dehydrogenase family protein [Massilia glaciei]PWF54593.1 UDP-glucose/GDP-mannose dehydrogenase family protein [Massilia glaciei]